MSGKNHFKGLLKNRILIAVVSFILGASSVWTFQKLTVKQKKQRPRSPFSQFFNPTNADEDSFFDEDFFDLSADPFAEMQKLRQKMMQNPSEKTGGAGEIHQREDANNVYYDISVKGLDQEKLKIDVENGQISISGNIEQKKDESGAQTFFSSSFHRSFPIPPNVDENRVQIHQEKDKLIIQFPKT